jgi:DNA-damage-inducible protein D
MSNFTYIYFHFFLLCLECLSMKLSQTKTQLDGENQLTHTSPFDRICHLDERGKEYWYTCELGKLLGYSNWQSIQNILVKAREACEHNKQYALDHFYLQMDVKITGNGSLHQTEVYRLSRYACYLIILCADPHKPNVALGQAYFAYHTRRQELVDMISISNRPDHLKQEALHLLLHTYDFNLQKAARETWAVEPEDFAIFFNHGYMGLLE